MENTYSTTEGKSVDLRPSVLEFSGYKTEAHVEELYDKVLAWFLASAKRSFKLVRTARTPDVVKEIEEFPFASIDTLEIDHTQSLRFQEASVSSAFDWFGAHTESMLDLMRWAALINPGEVFEGEVIQSELDKLSFWATKTQNGAHAIALLQRLVHETGVAANRLAVRALERLDLAFKTLFGAVAELSSAVVNVGKMSGVLQRSSATNSTGYISRLAKRRQKFILHFTQYTNSISDATFVAGVGGKPMSGETRVRLVGFTLHKFGKIVHALAGIVRTLWTELATNVRDVFIEHVGKLAEILGVENDINRPFAHTLLLIVGLSKLMQENGQEVARFVVRAIASGYLSHSSVVFEHSSLVYDATSSAFGRKLARHYGLTEQSSTETRDTGAPPAVEGRDKTSSVDLMTVFSDVLRVVAHNNPHNANTKALGQLIVEADAFQQEAVFSADELFPPGSPFSSIADFQKTEHKNIAGFVYAIHHNTKPSGPRFAKINTVLDRIVNLTKKRGARELTLLQTMLAKLRLFRASQSAEFDQQSKDAVRKALDFVRSAGVMPVALPVAVGLGKGMFMGEGDGEDDGGGGGDESKGGSVSTSTRPERIITLEQEIDIYVEVVTLIDENGVASNVSPGFFGTLGNVVSTAIGMIPAVPRFLWGAAQRHPVLAGTAITAIAHVIAPMAVNSLNTAVVDAAPEYGAALMAGMLLDHALMSGASWLTRFGTGLSSVLLALFSQTSVPGGLASMAGVLQETFTRNSTLIQQFIINAPRNVSAAYVRAMTPIQPSVHTEALALQISNFMVATANAISQAPEHAHLLLDWMQMALGRLTETFGVEKVRVLTAYVQNTFNGYWTHARLGGPGFSWQLPGFLSAGDLWTHARNMTDRAVVYVEPTTGVILEFAGSRASEICASLTWAYNNFDLNNMWPWLQHASPILTASTMALLTTTKSYTQSMLYVGFTQFVLMAVTQGERTNTDFLNAFMFAAALGAGSRVLVAGTRRILQRRRVVVTRRTPQTGAEFMADVYAALTFAQGLDRYRSQ